MSELKNNSASCIPVPYNIEVRPGAALRKAPVTVSLKTALGACVFVHNDFVKPFYLWGDVTALGDVLVNAKPLAKGTYFLETVIDGVVEKIKFTKTLTVKRKQPTPSWLSAGRPVRASEKSR